MAAKKGRLKRFLLYSFLTFVVLVIAGTVYFYFRTKIDPPYVKDMSLLELKVTKIDSTYYTLGNNWLKKNEGGLWEMYVEGAPFERGVVIGKLAKHLIRKQEDTFVAQIKKMIPSESYLKFLKYFIAWFNRDLDDYIDEEYKLEIYGESFAASHDYDFIGEPYHRMLNYHGAHDIGHALQDKNMVVGCTSFGVWDNRTSDSSMIIGRNFDFFAGEGFAEDKIILFINPDKGHKFSIVTWGGMIGAVSGMNDQGLTVTMNAGKSEIPTGAATPISILGREILQYASNIDEAYAIAKKRKTFVAEALMIGSSKDGKTAIIEKSPNKIDILYPGQDQNDIVCANHFRSNLFKNEAINLKNIKESASFYRYNRMLELLQENQKLDYLGVAKILRDQKGQGGEDIGMGNELAVNQLIAHHAIIFKPEKNLFWISNNPFQLGKFYAFDLDKVFSGELKPSSSNDVSIDSLNIPEDPFLKDGYYDFLKYKKYRNKITDHLKEDDSKPLSDTELKAFEESNPEYFYVYSLLGDYHKKQGNKKKAIESYKKGLTKVISTQKEKDYIIEQLKKLEE